MKNIVITGVSSGIGYGMTKLFVKKGYCVFGSVRKKEDADRLVKEFGSNFNPLIFDISDRTAISIAADYVKEKIGNNGLSGLINNAGSAEAAPLMHMQIESFRRQLEVLLIGHLNVIQEFLPLLGASETHPVKPGRIFNISSTNGKMAAPFIGSYVAAKHALEGMSDTLRIELQIYGIDVITVRPGMVKTDIYSKSPDDNGEKYRNTDFYLPMKKFHEFLKKTVQKNAFECDEFSERFVRIFECRNPKTRYNVVKSKFINWTLVILIPERIKDKIFARLVGLMEE
jgi:NAD(P)-dependent dehydrogenase (short-subunit alcohol dehydrogenase family)